MIQLNPDSTIKPNFRERQFSWGDLLLLGLSTVLGLCLRFINLTTKPLWTDEFATIVFSLGNNYQSILLNQVIKVEDLLQPLRPNPDATLGKVVSLLLHQDNHPPLYFWLSHLWLRIFPLDGEYVSLWAMRSLPALLGVLSIPAIYYLARLAFSSRLIAQLASVMMAVSPYGIYLAQESRHYTLGVLWVIFSLCCLVVATRNLREKRLIPWGLVWVWTLVNCIGLGVHYFFSITLLAELIALIVWLGLDIQGFLLSRQDTEGRENEKKPLIKILMQRYILGKNSWRLGLVILATSTTALIWTLTMIPGDYGNGMTDWMKQIFSFRSLISPIFQLLAAWITMICLLPVESSNLGVVIISGLIMLLFFLWATPRLYWSLKISLQSYQSALGVQVLGSFILGAIALFLVITYILGMDITKGARYNFVYFPAVIVLLGASLGGLWYGTGTSLGWRIGSKLNLTPKTQGKIAVILIGLMGLLGGITVNINLGYQKYYLPDKLVNIIAQNSANPVLIATTHQSLVHSGEMMGIAWELRKHPLAKKTQFLLAHKPASDYFTPTKTIQTVVKHLSHPLDLWIVNFSKEPENGLQPLTLDPKELPSCDLDYQTFPYINGYSYQHYRCQ
jgi:uncharacterized membrane protein